MTPRVLVVEDESLVRELYVRALRQGGFDASGVGDAAAARAALRLNVTDVVTVDLGLPDQDGMSFAEELRRSGDVGLIVVSRRQLPEDRVAALRAGCDDFLVKPVHLGELCARAHALVRRKGAPRRLAFGNVELDLGARRTTVDGSEVELTRGEFTILAMLAGAGGAALDRERLCQAVARSPAEGDLRTVDALVRRIRRKFEALGTPELVETIAGIGYRLGRDVSVR